MSAGVVGLYHDRDPPLALLTPGGAEAAGPRAGGELWRERGGRGQGVGAGREVHVGPAHVAVIVVDERKVEETRRSIFRVFVKVMLPNVVKEIMRLDKTLEQIFARWEDGLAEYLHVGHDVAFLWRKWRWDVFNIRPI